MLNKSRSTINPLELDTPIGTSLKTAHRSCEALLQKMCRMHLTYVNYEQHSM